MWRFNYLGKLDYDGCSLVRSLEKLKFNFLIYLKLSCDGFSADSFTVHVGDWDSHNGGETGEFSVVAREVIIHQDYGTNGMAHDVCLLNVPTLSVQKVGFTSFMVSL